MMIALRKQFFALGREQFVTRVNWHGVRVGEPDWTGQQRLVAFHLPGSHGQPHLYVLFNAHWEWQKFSLPAHDGRWNWRRLVDTNLASPHDIVEPRDAVPLRPADCYLAAPRSAVILISGS
jgi:glycogen operon protein